MCSVCTMLLQAGLKGALQLQNRCRVLDAKLSRGVREELLRSLRLKEAAKPSWGLFLVAIAQRFEDVHMCLAFGKDRSAGTA